MKIKKIVLSLLVLFSIYTIQEMEQVEAEQFFDTQNILLTAKAEDKKKDKDKDKKKDKKDKDDKKDKEEDDYKVDETNEDPYLYAVETGQLQVQTTGDELQADIYLVLLDQEETERTIYISPYRDSKNEQRVPAGEYTIKEIYLLDKDYQDTYEFEHNERLLVFPDEKVFFDINVIEVKESKPNELLNNKNDNQTTEDEPEQEVNVASETKEQEKNESNSLLTTIVISVVIIGAVIYAVLRFFGLVGKK